MEIIKQREPEESDSQENSILESLRKARLLVGILVGAALGGAAGCNGQKSFEDSIESDVKYGKGFKKHPNSIQYIHDKRTDRCFVAQSLIYRYSLMPITCDEKVIKQAEKDAK